MKLHHILAAAACVIALAACQQQTPAPQAPAAGGAGEERAQTIPANCPVLAHRKWSAEMTAGAERTLTVEGEIDLPRPGYSVSLARPATEADTGAQTSLTLTLTPPTDVVAEVVTPTPVRYFAPAAGDYRRVHIVCGDGNLRTIRIKRPE